MATKAVMLRSMRLKVLYTFDQENKVNCLARWPHIVNVQTVDLDETTSIGVIELKTCIQAVVSASPELVARLGQDYTIYAYDYSELDTPLVGQGMLSWALSSSSSDNGAATPRSQALVTGRVSKNVLGLFTSGASETLEVKLRLVPVPACLQSEFVKNMDTYRELSRVMPTGFDPSSWITFLQEHPNARELAEQLRYTNQSRDVQSAGAGMEALSRLMSPGISMDPTQQFGDATHPMIGQPLVGVGSPFEDTSRTASPFPSLDQQRDAIANILQDPQPRPDSRGSMAGVDLSAYDMVLDTSQAVSETGDLMARAGQGEGPAKKRARTTKADWKGKALGGASAESLRVAASTAGSIRTLRPIAVRAPGVESSAFDELPRPPTPRPDAPKEKPRRGRPRKRTTLQCASVQSQASSLGPAESMPRQPVGVASAMQVPDEARNVSAASTPADIASSPPVMDHPSPAPSSPVLPMLPPHIDSGFMSGPAEERFEDDSDMRPIDDEDLEVTSRYSRRDKPAPGRSLLIEHVTPGPPELLPTRILPRPQYPRRRKKISSTSTPPSDANESPDELQAVVAPRPVYKPRPDTPQAISATSPAYNTSQQDLGHSVSQPGTGHTILHSDAGHSKPQPDTGHSTSQPDTGHSGMQPEPSHSMPQPDTMHTISQPDTSHNIMQPAVNHVPAPSVQAPPPSLSRTPSMGGLILPPSPADDPADTRPVSTSTAAADSAKTCSVKTSQLRSGSGAKRKKAILNRLHESIDMGKMPPYCQNCGAIETPTWRKAWTKFVVGSALDVGILSEEAGFLAIRNVLKDGGGRVVSCNILKKALLPDDEGFQEMQFCNPCGLWLNKFKCMRPEERWNKDGKGSDDKGKKSAQKRKQSDAADEGASASDVPDAADAQGGHAPAQHASDSTDQGAKEPVETVPGDGRRRAASLQPQSFEARDNSGSSQTSMAAAMGRAVQSSPARGLGTEGSPIELDDFGSTRRLLFPSPNKASGGGKALQDITSQDNGRLDKSAERAKILKRDDTSGSNKENMTPSPIKDLDDLEKLFEEDGDDQLPRTPPRKSPSSRTLGSSSRPTSLRRRMLHPCSSSSSSPWKFDLSPSSQRQALLSRTPNSRNKSPRSPGSNRPGTNLSPFTKQMYQLLSEANYSPTTGAVVIGGGDDTSALPAFGDLLLPSGAGASPPKPSAHQAPPFSLVAAADLDMDLLSTDIPMPSSPPNFFSLYQDPVEPASGVWSDFDVPDDVPEKENEK